MEISRFHYITQRGLPGLYHAIAARKACELGANWVSLTIKHKSYKDWRVMAQETLKVCQDFDAKLIINDNPLLAKEIGAHGAHLGRSDMPLDQARALCGDNFILGGSANNLDDMKFAQEHGADYVSLGPIRYNKDTEHLDPILGIEKICEIMESAQQAGLTIPIIPTGGVSLEDVAPLLEHGAYGIGLFGSFNNKGEDISPSKFIERIYKTNTL